MTSEGVRRSPHPSTIKLRFSPSHECIELFPGPAVYDLAAADPPLNILSINPKSAESTTTPPNFQLAVVNNFRLGHRHIRSF
jgi:hypothetical protein